MEIEGRLEIFRLDGDTDPQRWTYRVSFIPTTTGGSVRGRLFRGEHEVKTLLKALHIDAEIIDRVLKSVSAGESPQIPRQASCSGVSPSSTPGVKPRVA